VQLAYDDAGRGECVVLVHGHPFDRTLWEPQIAALSDRFHVLAPDLRGFGESPVTPGTVTMREYAADIEELLDGLGITRAAVVGLSMGGLVTMELAAARPERCWAIGLVATTAEPVAPAEPRTRRERAEAVGRGGGAARQGGATRLPALARRAGHPRVRLRRVRRSMVGRRRDRRARRLPQAP
jgi:3-oxoadipate enol-lactonase